MVPALLRQWLITAYRHVAVLSWPALIGLVVTHLVTSWILFSLTDEKAAELDTFWYYYAVTATTIGYGDITPATVAGRLIAVLWIMPGGIALFTTVITKLVQSIGAIWTKRMRGDGDYGDLNGHLVIMGWHPVRTSKLVQLLLADKRYDHEAIVLVARDIDRNPMPDHVRFVRVEALPSQDAIERSGARRAAAVVAMGADDNETLAIGLSIGALDPAPRIVAHFRDDAVAELLSSHCSSAECSVSLSVEMLARAAQDPGSTEVQRQIISPTDSPTQYRLVVPPEAETFSYGRAFAFFKERYDATVIALHRQGSPVEVNCALDALVRPGDSLFFLAAERLRPSDIDWAACLGSSRP